MKRRVGQGQFAFPASPLAGKANSSHEIHDIPRQIHTPEYSITFTAISRAPLGRNWTMIGFSPGILAATLVCVPRS